MRALVVVASKHGSTREIGEAITSTLVDAGVEAEFHDVADEYVLEDFDAVIAGSAVYMGHWMPEAKQFIDRNRLLLADRPVWLFSSGPLGDQSKGGIEPRTVESLIAETGAKDHRIFSGSLDATDLGRKERLVMKIVHAPSGDFRDWPEIEEWAREIASALPSLVATVA